MNDKRTTDEIDALAQEIRRVDGENNLGAGALAEALQPFLTELQHRREAEAEAIERCAKVADAYSDIWKRGRNPEDAPEARVGAGREIAEAIRALAASPSSPASGVRVKALEWRQSFDGMTRADTIVGRYEIWTYHEAGEWFWKREGSLTRAVADEDAAKAECQSDYEAKILSALGEHP